MNGIPLPRKENGMNHKTDKIKEANFEVTEVWSVEWSECYYDQDAPLNDASPMSPLKVFCEHCGQPFILTYERD